MDEPLSNLDAKLRKSLRKDIRNFQRDYGIRTVYVTHDQEEALMLSDRIAVFNKGVIEQIGIPDEIYNKSKTEVVFNFIGETNKFNYQQANKLKITRDEDVDDGRIFYCRPEKVTFSNNQTELTTIPAKITAKEFYGMYAYYWLQVDDIKLISFQRESRTTLHELGDQVYLGIDADNVLSFPHHDQIGG